MGEILLFFGFRAKGLNESYPIKRTVSTVAGERSAVHKLGRD